ncbi:hypothetical protein CHCC5027_3558 [Bacillus paralicheniformis]|uniref:hypothetical protein n=1 Tax=Bacillus paralicheniformis TaxID=1648923 RepID=UPI00119E3F81|nr:hypothetical protein [Bacillus paralicheniformis]TWJ39645.1 hypothetical protein CHCC5027_3558 [Bacillus paralicheniformis]
MRKSSEGKKVKNPPDALLEYELCKTFGWLPSELYEQDNETIEKFIIIMNALNDTEKKGSRKDRRNDLKQKAGVTAGR